MVDVVPGVDLQRRGDGVGGGDRLGGQEDGARFHAAAPHLLREGGQTHLEVELGRRDEGAASLLALQHAVDDEGVDRLTHGHAGHAEALAQLALGGDGSPRREALGDEREKVVAHDDVLRGRR